MPLNQYIRTDHEALQRIFENRMGDPDGQSRDWLIKYMEQHGKVLSGYNTIRLTLSQVGDPGAERRLKQGFLRHLAEKKDWRLAMNLLRSGFLGPFEGENWDLAIYFARQDARQHGDGLFLRAGNVAELCLHRLKESFRRPGTIRTIIES